MQTVTVSPKYQVVIPKDVRERGKIKVGQKVDVILYGEVIHLVPVQSIEETFGCLKGIPLPPFKREKTDRDF